MVVWLILGAFNLYNAPFCPTWWLTVFGFTNALFCFFMGWFNYRRARELAEEIDKTLTSHS